MSMWFTAGEWQLSEIALRQLQEEQKTITVELLTERISKLDKENNQLNQHKEDLLRELVRIEPVEFDQVAVMCVFCSRPMKKKVIDHTPDCLITRARALVGGGE
jgi:hypothetical protein